MPDQTKPSILIRATTLTDDDILVVTEDPDGTPVSKGLPLSVLLAYVWQTDEILPKTPGVGVDVDGVLLKDGTINLSGVTNYLGAEILLTRDSDSYEPALKMRRGRAGKHYPQNNDALGGFQFYGYNENISDYSNGCGMLAMSGAAWSASDRSAYVRWYVTNGTTTDWDAMVLTKEGNLNLTAGYLTQKPSASVTPANNGELVVEATSNTQLTFKLRGSDGVVRSGAMTLS